MAKKQKLAHLKLFLNCCLYWKTLENFCYDNQLKLFLRGNWFFLFFWKPNHKYWTISFSWTWIFEATQKNERCWFNKFGRKERKKEEERKYCSTTLFTMEAKSRQFGIPAKRAKIHFLNFFVFLEKMMQVILKNNIIFAYSVWNQNKEQRHKINGERHIFFWHYSISWTPFVTNGEVTA